MKWAGGFLGLLAAMVSGVTTFFNFGKLFEGHRNIATKYINVAGKCDTAIAQFRDELIDLSTLNSILDELLERYSEINDEAKAFPTNRSDFDNALKDEEIRKRKKVERQNNN